MENLTHDHSQVFSRGGLALGEIIYRYRDLENFEVSEAAVMDYKGCDCVYGDFVGPELR